jgi:hypothetical protein
MGWSGPLTHLQFLAWLDWLGLLPPKPEIPFEEWDRQVAESPKRAAMKLGELTGATVVTIKRSEAGKFKARELLLSGVSRKNKSK